MYLLETRMVERDEPLSDEVVSAWARLVRVSQSMLTNVEFDLKSKGFPPLAWYDALLELRRAGPAGLRPFELQDEILLAQYNLSRLVGRLSKAGYVQRQRCEEDGRGQVLVITPKGERLLEAMWPAYRAAIRIHFAHRLGGKNAKLLGKILGETVRARG